MTRLAITGATGEVGRRVVSAVRRAGVPLRRIVRDASRVEGEPGVETRAAPAYGDFPAMRSALDGVETLFLIPAAESADRVAQHRTAVDAAVAAGVRRIVYLSFLGAAPDATFTLARDHWHTEQHVRATGLRFTFLRMNLYLDFIPSMVGADGAIRGPAGDGRVSAILRDDVAAASAALLLSDADHDGRTYELTGAEAFTLAEAAAWLSRPGRSVRFEDETDGDALASRARFGAPEFEVRGWISSYQAIRDGSLARVSHDVQALTGRPPSAPRAHLARS